MNTFYDVQGEGVLLKRKMPLFWEELRKEASYHKFQK
jgi:hypothetical protein